MSPRKVADARKSAAASIVAPLREDGVTSEQVFAAFAELDELPADEVRAELAEWLGPSSDPEALDDATRRAHGMPRRALHLRTLAIVKDADVLDLGEVAEEQLRIMGKSWDGADREAFERLDGEVEGSFAGTLEHRVLADASDATNTPLYDVLLHESGARSGVAFHAGTTRIAAMISDGTVEARDRRVRLALEACLAPAASDVLETIEAPVVDAVPPAKAPRATAKRAPGKKTAAKKPAAKTTTAKKTTAKKATAEKTTTKTRSKRAASKKSTAE